MINLKFGILLTSVHARLLKQRLKTDRAGKSDTSKKVLALIKHSARTANTHNQIEIVKALYALSSNAWEKLLKDWAVDPDPLVRAAAIVVYKERWNHFDSDEYHSRSRLPYQINPETFKILRSDPYRHVQLELLRFMGKRSELFGGSQERKYFDNESYRDIIADILTGEDEEYIIAFLEEQEWQNYIYFTTVVANDKERSKLENIYDKLCTHPNLEIRRHALRLKMSDYSWRPDKYEQIKPLVDSNNPDDLRVAGMALFPSLTDKESVIPPGKRYFHKTCSFT